MILKIFSMFVTCCMLDMICCGCTGDENSKEQSNNTRQDSNAGQNKNTKQNRNAIDKYSLNFTVYKYELDKNIDITSKYYKYSGIMAFSNNIVSYSIVTNPMEYGKKFPASSVVKIIKSEKIAGEGRISTDMPGNFCENENLNYFITLEPVIADEESMSFILYVEFWDPPENDFGEVRYTYNNVKWGEKVSNVNMSEDGKFILAIILVPTIDK